MIKAKGDGMVAFFRLYPWIAYFHPLNRKCMRSVVFLFFVVVLYSCNNAPSPSDLEPETIDNSQITLDRLNEAIVKEPQNALHFRDRARYHFANGQIDQAIEDLNRAVKLDSLNTELRFERGELFYNLMRFDQAMSDYERCVQINGNATDCLLKLGEMNIHLRNYSAAIENINNALRVNEQLPFAYYMKGRIYKETGDTVLAASSYQTAIEVDPDYYDAYIEIGLLYTAAKSDLAMEYFSTALEIRPNSVEALYNLAYHYMVSSAGRRERLDQAFQLYDQITELDPSNATAPYNKGFIYLEYLQEYDSAAYWFAEATKLRPGYFQAYYNRGLALESLDRKEEALSEYNRALSLQPDFTPAAVAKGRVLGE